MRYNWKKLNKQQVGTFSEYFVKMEMTMYGFQVYSSEVDDRGIDFVARYGNGPFLSVQVKSVREKGYVFMQKDKFGLSPHTLFQHYSTPGQEWLNPPVKKSEYSHQQNNVRNAVKHLTDEADMYFEADIEDEALSMLIRATENYRKLGFKPTEQMLEFHEWFFSEVVGD